MVKLDDFDVEVNRIWAKIIFEHYKVMRSKTPAQFDAAQQGWLQAICRGADEIEILMGSKRGTND